MIVAFAKDLRDFLARLHDCCFAIHSPGRLLALRVLLSLALAVAWGLFLISKER